MVAFFSKRMRLALFLSILYLVTGSAPAPPQTCAVAKDSDAKVEPKDWGAYINGLTVAMKYMIQSITPETADKMGKIVTDPENAAAHVWSIFEVHVWIMAIFFILICIAFIILIATIVTCCCRCFHPDKSGANPKKCTMVTTLIFIFICGGICVGGAIAFLRSIDRMQTGLSGIGDKLNDATAEIGKFVGNYEKFMQCESKEQKNKLSGSLTVANDQVESATKKFEDKLDETLVEAKNTKAELGNMLAQVNGLPPGALVTMGIAQTEVDKLTKLDSLLTTVIQALDRFKIKLTKTKDDVSKKVNTLAKQINDSLLKVLEMVGKVKKTVAEIQVKMKVVWQQVDDITIQVSTGLQWTIVIPLILVVIMALAFIVLLIRFIHNGGHLKCINKTCFKCFFKVFAKILAIGGYAAMLISVLLFLMAAACFILAFASMFLCMGFFEDPDLMVFEALPDNIKNIGSHGYNYSIHEAFIKCKNDYPFFDALDGSRQLADKTLENQLLEIQSKDHSKEFRQYDINQNWMSQMPKNIRQSPIMMQPQLSQYTMKFVYAFEKFEIKVNELTSRSMRDGLTLEIDNMVDKLTESIMNHVAELLSALLDLSPQCDGMMRIWDKAGSLVCSDIAAPAQGAWVACVICGIGSFTVFHWMFKSTKYLANFGKNNEEADDDDKSEKSTKKKKDKKDKGKDKKGSKSASKSKEPLKASKSNDKLNLTQPSDDNLVKPVIPPVPVIPATPEAEAPKDNNNSKKNSDSKESSDSKKAGGSQKSGKSAKSLPEERTQQTLAPPVPVGPVASQESKPSLEQESKTNLSGKGVPLEEGTQRSKSNLLKADGQSRDDADPAATVSPKFDVATKPRNPAGATKRVRFFGLG